MHIVRGMALLLSGFFLCVFLCVVSLSTRVSKNVVSIPPGASLFFFPFFINHTIFNGYGKFVVLILSGASLFFFPFFILYLIVMFLLSNLMDCLID